MMMDALTSVADDILSDVVHATGIFYLAVGMHHIKEYTPCIDGYAGKKANNTCAETSICTLSHRTESWGIF
jgi:hypothetical protein